MDTSVRTGPTGDCRAAALGELRRSIRDDGGLPERAGGGFSPAATAWATLAFTLAAQDASLALRTTERLAKAQQPDGRVTVAAGNTAAVWPTPLALLAWQVTGSFPERRDRAERFLLSVSGVVEETRDTIVVGHDTTLRGWPWVLETHSWVEPTALAVIALRRAGRAAHPRVQEGVRLLLDRQLAGGGWNYGNTTVYGTQLVPQVDATGVALAALAGSAPSERVAPSCAWLESALPGVRTPFSLSWGIIGLSAWVRRPESAAAWVDESFSLAGRYGGYDTSHLALLLVARETGGPFSP